MLICNIILTYVRIYARCGLSGREEDCKCDWGYSGEGGVFTCSSEVLAAENLSKLLNAVPESLWWLFGAGYLGYTGARSFDKWRGVPR